MTGYQSLKVKAGRLKLATIAKRRAPPAQVKALATGRGTKAGTDRINADLSARSVAFRPDPGHARPHEMIGLLRALRSKYGQLVATGEELQVQIRFRGYGDRLTCSKPWIWN